MKMKQLILLLLTIPLLPTSVIAGPRMYQPGYSSEQKCYRTEYREEYIPGTSRRPGYVKTYRNKVEVPCRGHVGYNSIPGSKSKIDDNSCIEGSILGGILGGGAGAIASRGDGRLWAIPLGVVGGALVGCQVDGG